MNTNFRLPPERDLPSERQRAARSQLEHYAKGWRQRIAQRWGRRAAVLGLGVGLAVAGAAAASTIYLTKGPVPTVNGQFDINHAPDFISVVSGDKIVGYVPRKYVLPSPRTQSVANSSLIGQVIPVYGPDLKTLVGHMYPGVGFVPLGKSPSDVPCTQVSTMENGTTSTVPCPSVSETVPNVVGLATPTGVGKVQAAGLEPVPENEHSATVPNGQVVRTSPPAGTRLSARSPVIVFNSLGP